MIDKNTLLFENLLLKVDKKLPFLGMNPLNEASEKKKFFKSPDYNPVFRYAKNSPKVEKLFAKVEALELKDSIINRLLQQKFEKFKKTNAMIQNIGGDEFTFFSKEIFGAPNKSLVEHAYKILKKEPVKEEDGIDSKQVVEAMKKVLDDLGLNSWTVGIKKMPASAAVRTAKKRVFVRKNSKFSNSFLKSLIVHEIGTHVFRAANGEQQPYSIFRTGLPNYLMTEEGMAANAEEMNHCLNINTMRRYAGRVLAVYLALGTSFREVFNNLRKYFGDYLAWRITLRVKRGLTDTSKPGAYTKDHLYFKGYYEVKKFLEKRGKTGLTTLYYGRIGLEHVPLMKKINGLKEPVLTPVSEGFRKVLKEADV